MNVRDISSLLALGLSLGALAGCSREHSATVKPDAGRGVAVPHADAGPMRGSNAGVGGATAQTDAGSMSGSNAGAGGATARADAGPMRGSNDPGDPGVRYGTIADGTLSVADTIVGSIHFTVAAPNRTDRAHLFAVIAPTTMMGVMDYYLSLVFDQSAWHVGTYERAVGGRVSFALSNGKRYAANGSEIALTLTVTSANAETTEVYIKGQLEMTVPSVTAGEPPLTVKFMSN